jgi:hypothetical protein
MVIEGKKKKGRDGGNDGMNKKKIFLKKKK